MDTSNVGTHRNGRGQVMVVTLVSTETDEAAKKLLASYGLCGPTQVYRIERGERIGFVRSACFVSVAVERFLKMV